MELVTIAAQKDNTVEDSSTQSSAARHRQINMKTKKRTAPGSPGSTSESSESSSGCSVSLDGVIKKSDHRQIMQKLETVTLGERVHRSHSSEQTSASNAPKSASSPSATAASSRWSFSCRRDYRHTVFRSIMANTTNGDRILCKRLDACVSEEAEGDDGRLGDGSEGLLRLDMAPLLEGDGSKVSTGLQTDIIKDMLAFKGEPAAAAVITHPVMEAFLELKWRKVQLFFLINFFVYLVFLCSYSIFLGDIFYRAEKRQSRIIKLSELVIKDHKIFFPEEVVEQKEELREEEQDGSEITFRIALEDGDEKKNETVVKKNKTLKAVKNWAFKECGKKNLGFGSFGCQVELILLLSIGLLLCQELLQFYALGFRQYLRELENLLELVVLILALLSLWAQSDMQVLKWISAFGICLGYLELIFLMGRYPFLGGSISLMFYSIMRHLVRTLSNFLVLIIGFAFGFFLIHHGKNFDKFNNPGKAVLKTLVMVLGEFEFDDLYEAHSDDVYSLAFTMTLMVGLAIMGSLVLVNLIVALIVSDIGTLQEQAHLQAIVNKAQHIIHLEGMYRYVLCCCPTLRNKYGVPAHVLVCAHSMCKCEARKLDSDITDRLRGIVRRQRLVQLAKGLVGEDTGREEVSEVGRALGRLLRRSKKGRKEMVAGSFVEEVVDVLAEGWL